MSDFARTSILRTVEEIPVDSCDMVRSMVNIAQGLSRVETQVAEILQWIMQER